MSMVGHFEAGQFEDGKLTVLQSFTCDVPDLARAIEDEAEEDEDIAWIAGYDSDEDPTEEHLIPPDVVLAAVARVKAAHGDEPTFAYDIEGVTALCEFAKKEGLHVLFSCV